jgi:cell division protein FtsB
MILSPRRGDKEVSETGGTLAGRLLSATDSFLSSRFLWLGVFLAIIAGFIGYLFLSEDGFARTSGLKEKKITLEADNMRLEEENRLLMARLERLNTDPSFLESQARKKLRLVRSDEVIYRLSEEPDLSGDGEAPAESPE